MKLRTAAVTAYRLVTGRRLTVSRMSDDWLCSYEIENGKRQDDL